MELSEFVEEALAQIVKGVRAVQKRDDGPNIAAESMYGKVTDHLFVTGIGVFTVVDFDVSVVAETKGRGKGGIEVWGIEAGAALIASKWVRHGIRAVERYSSSFLIPLGQRCCCGQSVLG
jgi:hypothetical protein